MTVQKEKVAVIGEGWGALLSLAQLWSSNTAEIVWFSGSGSRLVSPLPYLESDAANIWREIALKLELQIEPPEDGSFLREFRNKAFRESVWTKTEDLELRREEHDVATWGAERFFVPVSDACFESPFAEIEEEIRKTLLSNNLKRVEEVPISRIAYANDSSVVNITLASGEEFSFDRVIFADKWAALSSISGIPKRLEFMKKREPGGVLQAVFTHARPISPSVREGFFSNCYREVGEEIQRSIFGYFFDGSKKSVWTIFLASDEGEDNHEITKKLRRLKQTLDRMFSSPEWLGQEKSFTATVIDEQVRFEEGASFLSGKPPRVPSVLPEGEWGPGKIVFLTDAYGPSTAAIQVGSLFSESLGLTPKQNA